MGARTGAEKRTRTEIRVEGRDSLGAYEASIEVGRKTRKEGYANE